MTRFNKCVAPARQRGMATLIVAVSLLGIVSGLTLFSLRYGMQDRRAIAEDAAARMTQEAAHAGLDQGLQYFRARRGEVVSTWLQSGGSAHPVWQRCAPTDTHLPCGAVAADVRANYLYLPAALDMRDAFPAQQVITQMDGHAVHYEVYALLCLIDTQQSERHCLPDFTPGNSAVTFSGPYSITLISRSTLTGEDAEKPARHALARETLALRAHDDAMLSVVPGSWSDAGKVSASGDYSER